jgi:hypothetical protein
MAEETHDDLDENFVQEEFDPDNLPLWIEVKVEGHIAYRPGKFERFSFSAFPQIRAVHSARYGRWYRDVERVKRRLKGANYDKRQLWRLVQWVSRRVGRLVGMAIEEYAKEEWYPYNGAYYDYYARRNQPRKKGPKS